MARGVDTMRRGPGIALRDPVGVLPPTEEATELSLTFEDNRLAGLVFGHYDQNVAHIERRLGVVLNALGNTVAIKGPPDSAGRARAVLENLYERVKREGALSLGDVDGAIQESALQGSLFPTAAPKPVLGGGFEQIATRKRGAVRARNAAQDAYLKALRAHELVFAEGPAGTGKTWLAVGYAVSLLEQGAVERLILSRPAVEAGERLGFLPGDMRDKVDPYLRPIYDALGDFMEARHVERGLATGMIEIAPLAFMRGRTLANAVVLLDEAQNTTSMQMKMFLTRLGEGSRMIINGDPTQIDLPPGQRSGLVEAVRILDGVEGIGRATFGEADVVRHDLVRRIVGAYDRAFVTGRDAGAPPPRGNYGRARYGADADVITLDIVQEGGDWDTIDEVEAVATRAAAAAARHGGAPPASEASLLLTDDAALRELNRRWRGFDKPTNVLSFPASTVSRSEANGAPLHLGDVAIAFETLQREARAEGKPAPDHLAHLVVHGVLHLLGRDHEEPAAADAMEALEVAALASIGVPDPYGETVPDGGPD